MTYRVIQWATGGVGRGAIDAIATHPELELVGCWVHGQDKVGRDAGELAGCGRLGVEATHDIEALLALDADCVLYSPMIANPSEIEQLLASGKNVVTPLGWFYPKLLDNSKLEAACAKGGTTLHGTGIHPGGITERFPLVVSALSARITHVLAEEFSDIRTYGAPQVVGEVMLFGKPVDVARNSPMLKILGAGFSQSLDMVADAIGVKLDEKKKTEHQMAGATAPIDSPVGTIEPGRVAGQRFSWHGCVGGEPVVTARVHWYMGRDDIDADWLAGDHPEGYFLRVEGDPPVEVALSGIHPHGDESLEALQQRNPGMVATAIHCVSAIPYVCAAEPGVKSYLDLPLVAGRAAPALRRAPAHGVERA
jgi:hypothetical protein